MFNVYNNVRKRHMKNMKTIQPDCNSFSREAGSMCSVEDKIQIVRKDREQSLYKLPKRGLGDGPQEF